VDKMKKQFLMLTPKPRPVKIELGGASGDVLAKALQARIAGRCEPVLELHLDKDFIAGIAAVYGLRYGHDLLSMLEAARTVEVIRAEEPEGV
jgi:hypothetical protein